MVLTPCFYPTTVLLLDDSQKFLTHIHENLCEGSFLYKSFETVKSFFTHLQTVPANQCLAHYLTYVDGKDDEHYQHNANIMDLRDIALHADRFQEVSVVVLDYDMPMMNGLDVAQQIKNPHIKKILLTGVADEHMAIEAFHKGLIDAYIRKDDPLFVEKLHNHIQRLQRLYFIDVFAPLTQTLHTYAREIANCEIVPFFTEEYVQAFENCLRQHNIVEYYLCEAQGTTLMLDAKGNSFGFFIRTEGDFEFLLYDQRFEDQSATLQKQLQKRHVMFCNDWRTTIFGQAHLWPHFMRQATPISSHKPFYWACDQNLITLDYHKHKPFAHYKQETTQKNSATQKQSVSL